MNRDAEKQVGEPKTGTAPKPLGFGYSTSRDWAELARLARIQPVICIVRYGISRDIAKTHHRINGEECEVFEIRSRGMIYVCGFGIEEFVRQCESEGVEFLVPSATL